MIFPTKDIGPDVSEKPFEMIIPDFWFPKKVLGSEASESFLGRPKGFGRASGGVRGSPGGVLGVPGGFGGHLGSVLGDPWGCPGGSGGQLGRVLGALEAILERLLRQSDFGSIF